MQLSDTKCIHAIQQRIENGIFSQQFIHCHQLIITYTPHITIILFQKGTFHPLDGQDDITKVW